MWPKALFWNWSLRSLIKAFMVGLICGIVWALASFTVTGEPATASWAFVASFFIDVTFIFLTVTASTIIGMSIHTWDVINKIIWDGRKMLVTRYLFVLLVSLTVGVAVRYINTVYHYPYDALAPTLFTFVVASGMSFSQAYHVYCIYAVMDIQNRREHVRNSTPNVFRRMAHWMVPFIDRTRVSLPWLHSTVIVVLALYLANLVSVRMDAPQVIVLAYSVFSSLLFTTWGLLRRIVDIVKPWGQRERLYPHFETYR